MRSESWFPIICVYSVRDTCFYIHVCKYIASICSKLVLRQSRIHCAQPRESPPVTRDESGKSSLEVLMSNDAMSFFLRSLQAKQRSSAAKISVESRRIAIGYACQALRLTTPYFFNTKWDANFRKLFGQGGLLRGYTSMWNTHGLPRITHDANHCANATMLIMYASMGEWHTKSCYMYAYRLILHLTICLINKIASVPFIYNTDVRKKHFSRIFWRRRFIDSPFIASMTATR